MKEISTTSVTNMVRIATFKKMLEMYVKEYGEENVYQIGDTTIAVKVDTAPTGEPIFSVFSPTIKTYRDRATKTKTIKTFNVMEERTKFLKILTERAEKEKASEIQTKEKIAKDTKAREKRKEIREQRAK